MAAAFDSDNFESLDLDILGDIIEGMPLLELLEDRVDRFNEHSVTVLLPMQASGSPAYDADGRLLVHLAWYPRLVRDIEQANRVLHRVVTEAAIPDLEANRDRLLERRFHWPS